MVKLLRPTKKKRKIMKVVRYIFLLGLLGLLTGCVTPADLSYIVPSEVVPSDAVVTPVYNSVPAYYTPPAPVYPAPVIIDHPGYDGPHHRPAPSHAGHPPAHGGRMEPARHAGPVRHAEHAGRGGPNGRPGGGRGAPAAAKRQAPGRAPSGRGGSGRGAPPNKGGPRKRK